MNESNRITVVGLGYVGLPLAVALARSFEVTGFDVDPERLAELADGIDRTREISPPELRSTTLKLTNNIDDCAGSDAYIVTVPTPVDPKNKPDLTAILSASGSIAQVIDPARRPIIVYESTVYPGVTEEVCGPEIERIGNLKRGRDFRLGYSPERINPGDSDHSIDQIIKVVAAEDEESLDQLATIYGRVTRAGVFRAKSIKTAEAAKVIENAQRDINIAFMNEVAQIFSKIGLSMSDVLAAARTKWNFLHFEPGLVGGHCIGVDPYYLSHFSEQLGHHPRVILAGRTTNDEMGIWIADALHERRRKAGSAIVLGLTFKENVPDLRNSKSVDLVRRLRWIGYEVAVADPIADPAEVLKEHGFSLSGIGDTSYDLVVGAVAHQAYRDLTDDRLRALVAPGGTLADLKNIWQDRELPGLDRWTL